jgi:hypothetical protein
MAFPPGKASSTGVEDDQVVNHFSRCCAVGTTAEEIFLALSALAAAPDDGCARSARRTGKTGENRPRDRPADAPDKLIFHGEARASSHKFR